MALSDALGFATGTVAAETLDSSKVRSNTISRAQEVGLVRVTRYGKTAGYVVSPEVVDDLSAQARKLATITNELQSVRPLLLAAARLGVRPEDAVTALMSPTREDLDVAALADLVAAAADDLDAARIARERLAQPADSDLGLDEVAAALGVNLDERREAVRAGTSTAVVVTA